MSEFDNARFRWLGKPISYPKGSPRWQRSEKARKLTGKTVRELIAATKRSTPWSLVAKRLIEIEGYQGRTTSDEMEERRGALHEIVEQSQPMTVRQVFYQATVHGIVEKEETGYDKVQRALADMRRGGKLPYEWIIDNTRWERRPYTYTGVADALQDTARTYRKTLWTDDDPCVQIWLEKDALSGVIGPITDKYDVSLMTARGFSSITFLRESAEKLPDDRKAYVYHLGDSDSYGISAGEKIEEDLRGYAPDVDLHFERLAVTEEQIEMWHLPTRPDKKTGEDAVELDAIAPHRLRSLVEQAIRKHMPKKKYEALMKQEERERKQIQKLVNDMEEQIDK